MPTHRLAVGAVAISLLALAACGDDDDDSADQGAGTTETATTETSTGPAKTGRVVSKVKVRETDFKLDPANPRIAKAGLVEFDVTNAGQASHALEVEGPSGEVETDTIEPGGKATLRADLSKPGSYVWYCPVSDHEQRGMKGRITVAGGGASGSEGASGRDRGSGERDDSGGSNGSGERDDSGGTGGSPGGY